MKPIYFLLFVSSVVLISCKKLGCTDINAMNYEKIAQKNDESCTYEGSIGIWFDSLKSIEYSNAGIQTLTYFINGINKGTILSSFYGNASTVTCDSQITFVVDFNLGKASTQSHKLIVKSETGALVDNYAMTAEGGKCTLFQMK
jgi:hypothetical protein|tara:strand:+ start:326 stop:757 length:432 start_codon:yes stop_codon:yes gene_type:complete